MKIYTVHSDHFIGKNILENLKYFADNEKFSKQWPDLEVFPDINDRNPDENDIAIIDGTQASAESNGEVIKVLRNAGKTILIAGAKNIPEDTENSIVYQVPEVFGKWGNPETGIVEKLCCLSVEDGDLEEISSDTQVEAVYIDDLVEDIIEILAGKDLCGPSCIYRKSTGEIKEYLKSFSEATGSIDKQHLPENSFEKKLFSTFVSFLPVEKAKYRLRKCIDPVGTRSLLADVHEYGFFTISVTEPGKTRAQHWHNSKIEVFTVVKGRGLVQERQIGSSEIYEYEVSEEANDSVYMMPGYIHNITNLSDKEDLILVIWASEAFDINKPDTIPDTV